MLLECSPAEMEAALARIFSSKLFSRSEKLRDFLRYVVEHELAGRGDQITEAVLSNEVYGRTSPRYQGTSIVRTEANRLRKRLDEYYEGPGAQDPLRIIIEPGSYRPRFVRGGGPSAVASPSGLRLLVWPLAASSSEPEASLLAGAVTESLVQAIDSYEGVTAIGAISSALAAQAGDVSAASVELGADRVVCGEVEVSGGVVTVAVEVADREGRKVWKQRLGRPAASSREAGAELARRLAQHLAPGSRSSAAPTSAETVRPEALLLVERGFVYARRRTRRFVEESLRYFNAALALEEDRYARAWAGRAEALMLNDLQSKERHSYLAQAKRAALKAEELDPSLWEGHAMLAALAWQLDWNQKRMEAAFQQCLRLDPIRTEGNHYYWFLLDGQGRLDEAIRLAAGQVDKDPLNFLCVAHLSYLQVLDGRHEEALQTASKAKALMPVLYLADTYAAFAAIGLCDWQAAYEYAERADALADGSTNTIGLMGFAAAKLGRARQAHDLLERAISQQEPCHQIACILFGLGEPDAACGWLEKGVERQETILLHLRRIPLIADYVEHPRLARLLDRIDEIRAGTP